MTCKIGYLTLSFWDESAREDIGATKDTTEFWEGIGTPTTGSLFASAKLVVGWGVISSAEQWQLSELNLKG